MGQSREHSASSSSSSSSNSYKEYSTTNNSFQENFAISIGQRVATIKQSTFDVRTKMPGAVSGFSRALTQENNRIETVSDSDRSASACITSDVTSSDENENKNDNESEDKNESENENEREKGRDKGRGGGGYDVLLEYMQRCMPSANNTKTGQNEGEGGEGDWLTAQAALTPTLLPTLRFHDLVFGHELGKGSFGTVKYARQIVRGSSRLVWPEFAVKIISAQTIEKENYSEAIIREMAILQVISHPGYARLISSFKYTHSAYLVLEYAGRGDLHSLVIRNSSRGPRSLPLSHLHTRFIISEIGAALLFLHSLGFSYNDLKPENVLITEVGHIKIADFGACRPFTTEAKKDLLCRMKNMYGGNALRNGDWRDEEKSKETETVLFDLSSDFICTEDEEDARYTNFVLCFVFCCIAVYCMM